MLGGEIHVAKRFVHEKNHPFFNLRVTFEA